MPRAGQVRGRQAVIALALLVLTPFSARGGEKFSFKPGYNFYSPEDDTQLGREASAQVNKQLHVLNDDRSQKYLSGLGRKLVAFAPNNRPEYAWEFRIVNSEDINAFALPGGFIYVNRAVLEAAEDEAQLAGVLAHESGHVVMRHGTHIASQAVLAQGGLALLTSIFGQSGSLTSQLAQLGLGIGVNSLMLKNSRSAETQADEVGTYILHQAGYDPHAMVQFFQIIAKRYPQRTLQFFSDHPSPENRITVVNGEIASMGPLRDAKSDNPEFEEIKQYIATLAPPPSPQGTPKVDANKQPPPPPSSNLIPYNGTVFTLDYPDNWQTQRTEDNVTMFPAGGIVSGAEGETSQAYGASISLYSPQEANWGLVDATQELLESMHQANPQMHILQQTGMNLRGNPAVSTLLQNDSPLEGQKETDHLVTVRLGEGVLAFIFIAPSNAFETYAPTFDKMLQSIDLKR